MSKIIDLHCHPALKPLGRSYSSSEQGKNQKDKSKRASIWHYDPPQGTDLFLQKLLGILLSPISVLWPMAMYRLCVHHCIGWKMA